MRLPTYGIPARVLLGKDERYREVAERYRSRLIQEYMKRLNESFWQRALTGRDRYGNYWKPLAPQTHEIKQLSGRETGTYLIIFKRKDKTVVRKGSGLLTPEEQRRYYDIYLQKAKELRAAGFSGEKAMRMARDAALKQIRSELGPQMLKFPDGRRKTPINVRTGRLVASTRPGPILYNRYLPVRDQLVKYDARQIHIKLGVWYAPIVDKQRELIPDNHVTWIREAHEVAIREARAYYGLLKKAIESRKGLSEAESAARYYFPGNRRNPWR